MESIKTYITDRITYGKMLPSFLSGDVIKVNIDRAIDYFKRNSINAGYYENISLKNNFEILTQQAHMDNDVLAVTEVNVKNEQDRKKKFHYNPTNWVLTVLDHTSFDDMNAIVIRYVGDDVLMSTQLFKDYCVLLCKKDMIDMLEMFDYKPSGSITINVESLKEDLKSLENQFWHNFV